MAREKSRLELTRWYEACSTDEHERLTAPARKAQEEWAELVTNSELPSQELEYFKNTTSFELFIKHARSTEQTYRTRRHGGNRDTVSKIVESIAMFANRYSEITDIVRADPFGAGTAVWGICSVILTVVAQKRSQQALMYESFTRISTSMPRLKAFSHLYPTERMISQLAELEAAVLMFLCTIFQYYQPRGLRGSWIRFKTSAFGDDIENQLRTIDSLGREVVEESRVALSSEVRTLRTDQTREFKESRKAINNIKAEVEELKEHVESNTEEIREQSQRIARIENRKYRRALEVLKPKLVALGYDALQTQKIAAQQVRHANALTSLQSQACQQLIESEDFSSWLAQESPSLTSMLWITSTNKNDSVSHIAHEVLERLSSCPRENVPIVIHSLFQIEIAARDTDPQRTATTLYREAIYQLLAKFPAIIHQIETFELASKDSNSELPATSKNLQNLLENTITSAQKACENDNYTPGRNELYWVIDRLDECTFRGSGAFTLYNLMSFLDKLKIKVLITSLYPPASLDKQWNEDIKYEGEIPGLRELVYKPVRVR